MVCFGFEPGVAGWYVKTNHGAMAAALAPIPFLHCNYFVISLIHTHYHPSSLWKIKT